MSGGPTSSSLLPREHGAYAQLAFPQLGALLLGGANLSAVLLTISIVCAFLVYEPTMVLAGRRGPRALKTNRQRAQRRIAALLVIAAVCAITGLSLSSAPVHWTMLGVVGLGTLVVLILAAGMEKSLLGEITVATTFASAAVPTALASGTTLSTSLLQAAVWAIAFLLVTLTVNVIIDQHKSRDRRAGWLVAGASIVVGAATIWLGRTTGLHRAFLAVLPVSVACVLVILLGLRPRQLRWVGWSIVASNIATLLLLLVLLR